MCGARGFIDWKKNSAPHREHRQEEKEKSSAGAIFIFLLNAQRKGYVRLMLINIRGLIEREKLSLL
jgi:hypothetical protein